MSRRKLLGEGLPCSVCGKPSADGWYCVDCWNALSPAEMERMVEKIDRWRHGSATGESPR